MKLITRGLVYTILQIFLISAAQATTIDEYKKISANGKFGLAIASTNEIVIDPIFDDVGWSDNSLSVIDGVIGFKENETWGLVDLQGKKIINTQYTALYPFTKNLLVVGQRSRFSILSQYGIINTKGKVVSALEFNEFTAVGENAIVSKRVASYERTGFISSSGKIIIPFEFESITSINADLLAVENGQNLSAIFDHSGSQKSEFRFESIATLEKGNLLISLYSRKGVIDENGKIILEPIYKDIRIENGEFVGESFNKWTLLDEQNRVKKTYYFDSVLPVTDQLFAVQSNGNFGIITQEGSYVSYTKNSTLSSSSNGLVLTSDDQYFEVLDSTGKTLLPGQPDSVWIGEDMIFSKIEKPDGQSWTPYDRNGKKTGYFQYEHFEIENEERLRARRNGKWGLLDKRGNEVSPFLYDSLGQLKDGLAKVYYLNNYGVINADGHWVVTPYKDAITITEKNIVYNQGSDNGIMDRDGNVLFRSNQTIQPLGQLFTLSTDNEQLIVLNEQGSRAILEAVDSVFHIEPSLYVFLQHNRWHVLNNTSHSMIQLRTDIQEIKGFEEDLISVRIDDQWGYIEEGGQLRVANRYDSVQHFSEGFSGYKLIGKWGFINKQEKIIVQPNYDEVSPFYGRLSIVKKGKLYGLIDTEGREVIEVKYQKIERFKDYILLYTNDQVGLANRDGTVLRTPQYSQIRQINKTYFIISKGNKHGVITIKGLDVIPLAYDEIIPTYDNQFLVKEKPIKGQIK